MKSIIISVFVLCIVSLTMAQGVNGKWKGTMNIPNSATLDLEFAFKANGKVLEGNVTSARGVLPLQNGKITGDTLSFEVFTDGMLITCAGNVTGDKIKLFSKELNTEISLAKVSEGSKITGSWLGKVQGPEGEMEITLTFKVDGDKLTGTNKSPMGVLDLTNGKVNGNDFTFDIDLGGNTISHKCKYATDDTIDVSLEVMGQEMKMKLTRVKL
jgi:hypothetical protein